MNEQELFRHYEKLYFDEMDRREKISARLNLPLGILLAQVAFLSVMQNGARLDPHRFASIAFWILFTASIVATVVAAWYFRKAWFGFTDKLLPTANATETYRRTLMEHYKSYDNADELVERTLRGYLSDYYMQFSSANAVNNDARSYNLYRSTKNLAFAVAIAFAAYVPFMLLRP